MTASRRPTGYDSTRITCFRCGEQGHIQRTCPKAGANFCGTPHSYTSPRQTLRATRFFFRKGLVDGEDVEDICIDTGCSQTLVHSSLISKDAVLPDETVDIQCAHGDITTYPLADVELVIDGVAQEIRVGVAQSLPHSVLLGTDVPHLIDLLATPTPDAPEDALVATRAQLRRQERDASLRYTRQLEDDARTHSLINHSDAETDVSSSLTTVSPPPASTPDDVDTPELMPLDQGHDDVDESDSPVFSFDDDIFAKPGSSRTRLSRSERRRHNRQVTSALDLYPETLRTLQRADGTLNSLWRSAHPSPDALTGSGFFLSGNGLLYHRWHPGRDASSPVDQLVLPSHCRRHVLELAHSIPLAGHLFVAKTTHRLLHRFFWPSLHADVKRFCNECHECQKTSARRPLRAPLVPLPIIDEPFHRIGMDLVGPLPCTAAGNKFILVICDYATRYPEAIALPDITAETVAEHLITLFTRVGILAAEILTDQGANFMSALLKALYKRLNIKSIRTSPYHPQSDGLVERFNQTLKAMLRKFVSENNHNWDKDLPYLLFAYREVPQASTGFSPFELLYGRSVRGPLDVLKESWTASTRADDSVVSHLLDIRDRLAHYTELVAENLTDVQKKQKQWYDRTARSHKFAVSDQVLVLLPTSRNKLLAQWEGPYPITRVLDPVNYEVNMFDKRKKRRVFHVNMLRQWHTPTATSFMAETVTPLEADDIHVFDAGLSSQPRLGEHLSVSQGANLTALVEEYSPVLSNQPGRTTLAEHDIVTTDTTPIRLHPYRLPHNYRNAVKEEIDRMLQHDIIEPSTSDWAFPIVLSFKKDGSLRLCVDYRKLNAVSTNDAYPMPRIDDMIDRLGKARYFTVLDLTRGYWQVPVTPSARPKTAFTTPFGLF